MAPIADLSNRVSADIEAVKPSGPSILYSVATSICCKAFKTIVPLCIAGGVDGKGSAFHSNMIKADANRRCLYRSGDWQAPEAAPRQPADGELLGYAISVAEPLAVDNYHIILFVFDLNCRNI